MNKLSLIVDKKPPRKIGIKKCEDSEILDKMYNPISLKDLSNQIGLGLGATRIRIHRFIREGKILKSPDLRTSEWNMTKWVYKRTDQNE